MLVMFRIYTHTSDKFYVLSLELRGSCIHVVRTRKFPAINSFKRCLIFKIKFFSM